MEGDAREPGARSVHGISEVLGQRGKGRGKVTGYMDREIGFRKEGWLFWHQKKSKLVPNVEVCGSGIRMLLGLFSVFPGKSRVIGHLHWANG